MDDADDQFSGEEQSDEPGSKELKAQIDAILVNTLEEEIPGNDAISAVSHIERSVGIPKPMVSVNDDSGTVPDATESVEDSEDSHEEHTTGSEFPSQENSQLENETENVISTEDLPEELADHTEDPPEELADHTEDLPEELADHTEDPPEELADHTEDLPEERADHTELTPQEIGQVETKEQNFTTMESHLDRHENRVATPNTSEEVKQANNSSVLESNESYTMDDDSNSKEELPPPKGKEDSSTSDTASDVVPNDFHYELECALTPNLASEDNAASSSHAGVKSSDGQCHEEDLNDPKECDLNLSPNEVEQEPGIQKVQVHALEEQPKNKQEHEIKEQPENGQDLLPTKEVRLGDSEERNSVENKSSPKRKRMRTPDEGDVSFVDIQEQRKPKELGLTSKGGNSKIQTKKKRGRPPSKVREESLDMATTTPKEESEAGPAKKAIEQENQGEPLYLPEGWRFYACRRPDSNGGYTSESPHWDLYYMSPPPRIKFRSRKELADYLHLKGLNYDIMLFFCKHEIQPALDKGILKYYDEKTVIPASEVEPCRGHRTKRLNSTEINIRTYTHMKRKEMETVNTEKNKKNDTEKEKERGSVKQKRAYLKKKRRKPSAFVVMRKIIPSKERSISSSEEKILPQETKNVSEKEMKSAAKTEIPRTSVGEKRSVSVEKKQTVTVSENRRQSMTRRGTTINNTPIRATRQSSCNVEEKSLPVAKPVEESPAAVKKTRERNLSSPVQKLGVRLTRSSIVETAPADVVKVEEPSTQSEITVEEKVQIRSKPKVIKSSYFSSNLFYPDQPKSPAGLRRERNTDAPPRSPFNLIQEDLFHDPWQLLIATIFLNSTSGKIAIPLALEFLKRWPTPQAACQANVYDILDVIEPLGFGRTRAAIIIRFSYEFLSKEWKLPNELYGIGKYGTDSYKIFCMKNEWKRVDSDDPMLMMYLNWRKATEHLRKKFLKSASDSSRIDPDDILSSISEPRPSNISKRVGPSFEKTKQIPPSKQFDLSDKNTPPKKRLRNRTATN